MNQPVIFNRATLEELASTLGDAPEEFDAFMDDSLPDLASQVDAVSRAALVDSATLAKAAHFLKGGSGALGAEELRLLTATIEQQAKNGAFGDHVKNDLKALQEAHARFINAVKERLYR